MAGLRAAGQEQEADDAFHAFTLMPDVQRTEALARAWEDHAEHGASPDASIDALAQAYLESRDPTRQREVLLRLADRFEEANRPHGAASVLQTLERGGLSSPDSPPVQALLAWVATADLRLGEAAARWAAVEGSDGPRARGTRALALATRLGTDCPLHGCQL